MAQEYKVVLDVGAWRVAEQWPANGTISQRKKKVIKSLLTLDLNDRIKEHSVQALLNQWFLIKIPVGEDGSSEMHYDYMTYIPLRVDPTAPDTIIVKIVARLQYEDRNRSWPGPDTDYPKSGKRHPPPPFVDGPEL